MANVGSVLIQFAVKSRDAIKDVDKLRDALDKSGKAAGGLGGVLKSSLKAGVAGVGIAAVGAGIAFVDMAKAAYADKQAADRLARTMGKVKGVTEAQVAATADWVDQMELATGIADDDLRQALGRLIVVTGDATKAQELAALAADASVSSGKSFQAVYEAMAKAADGNTRALDRMFPQLDAGPDKVLTLKEAVDQLTSSYGGAAKAAEDNDLFGRIGTIWGQLKEALGSAALPLLEDISAWFKDKGNISNLQGWIDKIGEWTLQVGEEFAGKVREFVDWLKSPEGQEAIRQFSETLRGIGDAAKWCVDQIGPLFEALKTLKKFTDLLPSNLILKALGLLPGGGGGEKPAPPKPVKPVKPAPGVTGGAWALSGGGNTFNIYNPKPERASDSIAAQIRQGRIKVM